MGNPLLEDSGHLLARAIGFSPMSSSVNLGWRNAVLYSWNGVLAQSCVLEFPNAPVLALHLAGQTVKMKTNMSRGHEESYPGLLTLYPASTSVSLQSSGSFNSLSVLLNTETSGQLRYLAGFKDEYARAAICCLANELNDPSEVGPLYADSIANALGMHLRRKCASSEKSVRTSGMPRGALQMALEIIEESIETGVPLERLANAVGFSRAHFSKAFKLSTGFTPHSYLTNRRISRARDLLANSDETIAQISILSGFSTQAHFTDCFKRATGHTPLKFRRSVR